MKSKQLFVLVTGLVLVSLILAACGGKTEFPTGKFLDAEFTQYSNSGQGAGFVFTEDGTWRAFSGDKILAFGTYSVEGDLYIEETNDGACATPMSFKYYWDGTNLKFELTEQSQNDTCSSRRNAFDGKTYTQSK